MEAIFLTLLGNSIAAVPFILVIAAVRALTAKLPKIYVWVLWLLLLIQLVFPPVFASPFGLPRDWARVLESGAGDGLTEPEGTKGAEALDSAGIPAGSGESMPGAPGAPPEKAPAGAGGTGTAELGAAGDDGRKKSAASDGFPGGAEALSAWFRGETGGRLLSALSYIWFAGAAVVLLFFGAGYVRLRRRIMAATRLEGNVWETEGVESPFVVPGFPSRIYLPYGMDASFREDVLAHERQHIRQGDPWVKLAAFAAAALHWYNPFVWAAVRCMGRDMEMLCDERVLGGRGLEERQRYSRTLLACSAKAGGLTLSLPFGESNTEGRIRHILNGKKPGLLLSAALCAVILSCGAVFLTSQHRESSQKAAGEGPEYRKTMPERSGDIPVKETMPAAAPADGESGSPEDGYGDGGADGQAAEDDWWNRRVVGGSVTPDKELKAALSGEVPDYSDDWDSFTRIFWEEDAPERASGEPGGIAVMRRSDSFTLYGLFDNSGMLLETGDGGYVEIKCAFLSNYMIQPKLWESDFDGDGEPEAAINFCIMHGTGMYVESLFMADRQGKDWQVYQLLEEDYLEQLGGHVSWREADSGPEAAGDSVVMLLVDGAWVGRARPDFGEKGPHFDGSAQIGYEFDGKKITLRSDYGVFSDENPIGNYYGDEVEADVKYGRDGNWTLENFRYADEELERAVESALTYYYRGGKEEEKLNSYCAAEGTALKAREADSVEISIDEYRYDRHDMMSEPLTVTAQVRQEGADSYDYVTLEMVYGTKSDIQGDNWYVVSISEEK